MCIDKYAFVVLTCIAIQQSYDIHTYVCMLAQTHVYHKNIISYIQITLCTQLHTQLHMYAISSCKIHVIACRFCIPKYI